MTVGPSPIPWSHLMRLSVSYASNIPQHDVGDDFGLRSLDFSDETPKKEPEGPRRRQERIPHDHLLRIL